MPIFDQDQLYSTPVATPLPDSALFSAPSSGIGMADTQAPTSPPYIRPSPSPRDQIQAEIAKMSGLDKFFAGLGEFGAGVTGRPSPLMQRVKQQREEKILRLQEIKIFNDTTKDVLDNADRLEGNARTQYLNERAASLDSIVPGSGDMLKSLSDDSGYGKMVLKYAHKSGTLKMTLETGGMPAAVKLFKSTEGKKLIQSEIESAALPDIRTKLTTLGQLAPELLSPEELKKVNEDGIITPDEAVLINQRAAAHDQYKVAALSEEQLTLANKHQDATYALSGFATSKTAQEIMKKKAERPPKEQWTEPYQLGGAFVRRNLDTGKVEQVVSRPPVTNINIKENDKKFEKEDKLRNDYTANPKVKAAAEMDFAFKIIESAFKNPSPANDLAMATKYMKILDPTSVVRESEFGMAVSATGLFDKIQNYATAVLEGEKLNPAQRKDFYDSAKAINDTFQQGRGDVDKEYSDMAVGYGLDPKNVIPSLRTGKKTDKTAPPAINSKGWKLMIDAKGNKAYVGPNKEIEEVK